MGLTRSFVDLEPGWRIVTVTPLRREEPAGEWVFAVPKLEPAGGDGMNQQVRATGGGEFGFEESIYSVGADGIRWRRGERSLSGRKAQVRGPMLKLFPEAPGRMRLLFLTRASEADYNMAVLVSGDGKALDEMTERVRASGGAVCGGARCRLIPVGVAVRPEKRNGKGGFVPAL